MKRIFTRQLAQAALWAAFVLLLAYHAIGVFPIVAVEGGDLGISNGVLQIESEGLASRNLAYRYEIQSGSYALIRVVHHMLGLHPLTAFAVLTAACGLAFIVLTALFASRLTGRWWPLCGIVLLLFQETYTALYYANTNAIAALFGILALLRLRSGRRFPALALAGFMFGLGAWMRLDVLLIAPAALAILHDGRWTKTLARTAIVAAVAVVTTLVAIYASDSSLAGILEYSKLYRASSHQGTSGMSLPLLDGADFEAFLTFFSLLIGALIVLGLATLALKRELKLLGIFALGVFPLFIYYTGAVVTPKYMYYLLPFFLMAAMSAFPPTFLNRRGAVFSAVALLLFFAQYLIGVRAAFPDKPYVRVPFPTLATLANVDIGRNDIDNLAVVVGAGSVLSTADGYRMTSGLAFAPLIWYYYKSFLAKEVDSLERYLARNELPHRHFLTTSGISRVLVMQLLLNRGFRLASRDYRLERLADSDDQTTDVILWKKGTLQATLNSAKTADLDAGKLLGLLGEIGSDRVLYVIAHGRELRALVESGAAAEHIVGFVDVNPLAAYEVGLTSTSKEQR